MLRSCWKPSSGWYTVIWKSGWLSSCELHAEQHGFVLLWSPGSRVVLGLSLTRGHLRRADLGHPFFSLTYPWHPGVSSSHVSLLQFFSSWPWVLGSHLHKHPWPHVSWQVERWSLMGPASLEYVSQGKQKLLCFHLLHPKPIWWQFCPPLPIPWRCCL